MRAMRGPDQGAGKISFFKKRFRFLKVFLGFSTKTKHEIATQKHIKHRTVSTAYMYLTKQISMSEKERHVKNEHKINESHKSQLKFYLGFIY